MNILMILTSHEKLGGTEAKTGFWLETLAAPYHLFQDAGAQVTLASPRGGPPPLDPMSDEPAAQTDATRRFQADPVAQAALANAFALGTVPAADFDALFYPGGRGPLWDLAEDIASIALIEAMVAAGKPVVTVGHGAGVLHHAKTPGGAPVMLGQAVTGFSTSEEQAAGLATVVPFLVQDMLIRNGGTYSKKPDGQAHVVTAGLLITGQNAASAAPAAQALLALLAGKSAASARTPPAPAADPVEPEEEDLP